MTEVGTGWPLINYIVANPDYLATYKSYVKSFVETSFEYNRMNTIYSNQQSLLTTSASNEKTGFTFLTGVGSFNTEVANLKTHCSTRITAANAFVK